jgi:hypothetical protein
MSLQLRRYAGLVAHASKPIELVRPLETSMDYIGLALGHPLLHD